MPTDKGLQIPVSFLVVVHPLLHVRRCFVDILADFMASRHEKLRYAVADPHPYIGLLVASAYEVYSHQYRVFDPVVLRCREPNVDASHRF